MINCVKGHRGFFADAQPDMQSSSAFVQLGSTARDCLTDGRRGKVLAVFSKAIYLLTETDELFWIMTDDALMHRRCAQVSPPLPRLLAGSLFRVQNHHLTVDPDFLFEMDSASPWNAPRATRVLDISVLSERIHSFFLASGFIPSQRIRKLHFANPFSLQKRIQ